MTRFKDSVNICQVSNSSWTTKYEQEKKQKKIARVVVIYHDVEIICHLMSVLTDKNEESYFISLPNYCFNFRGKMKKSNYVNFSSKDVSNQFQSHVLGLLRQQFPQIFVSKKTGKKDE
jgi:hypothetical protein